MTTRTPRPRAGGAKPPSATSPEDINRIMDGWARQFETLMQQHPQTIEEARKRYEQQVADAEASLQAIIQSGSGQVPGPKQPQPGGIDMSKPPAAEWMQLESGEKFLVLNVQAAVMFMAIFERLGPVLEEVKTLVTKMRK